MRAVQDMLDAISDLEGRCWVLFEERERLLADACDAADRLAEFIGVNRGLFHGYDKMDVLYDDLDERKRNMRVNIFRAVWESPAFAGKGVYVHEKGQVSDVIFVMPQLEDKRIVACRFDGEKLTAQEFDTPLWMNLLLRSDKYLEPNPFRRSGPYDPEEEEREDAAWAIVTEMMDSVDATKDGWTSAGEWLKRRRG